MAERYFFLLFALASCNAAAAQDSVTANRDNLLNDIEVTLQQAQIMIIEQAQTDRFAIIYAIGKSDAHLTITLVQTPFEETQLTLNVTSDSPSDEAYDRELLQIFLQTQL